MALRLSLRDSATFVSAIRTNESDGLGAPAMDLEGPVQIRTSGCYKLVLSCWNEYLWWVASQICSQTSVLVKYPRAVQARVSSPCMTATDTPASGRSESEASTMESSCSRNVAR
jgi:hypothetical protein